MDNLDFLDSASAEDVATPAEPVEAPTVQQEAAPHSVEQPEGGPIRDDQGRFAPKQTQVPLSALEQERTRRQAAEEQLRQYSAQREVPDVFTDPEAFAAFQQEQAANIALTVKLDISEDMARSKHGEGVVDQARDWALAKYATNPAFRQEVLSHRNPYEYVVSSFKREQLFAEVTPEDLEQFRAWKAKANPLNQQQAQAAPQPVAPPRSIASVPNAGGSQPGAQPIYDGAAFDAVFRN